MIGIAVLGRVMLEPLEPLERLVRWRRRLRSGPRAHPNGQLLASGSRDGAIRLWDVAGGRPMGVPLFTHTDAVSGVTFSPAGDRLASSSRDGTVHVLAVIWDVAEACLLLEPHLARVDLEPYVAEGIDVGVCET